MTDDQPLLLRGFAPLVVAVALLVLGVLLVPSIAPEQVVLRRDEMTTTSPPPTIPPTPATAAPAPPPAPAPAP